MAKFRISYNAPVVLTFAIAAVIVFAIGSQMSSVRMWFVAWPELYDTRSYVGLVSHILGHASWQHLIGNFMLILLIGPILEERFGSLQLFVMILITALVTGIVNVSVSSDALLGASGIVFMMILLASTANIREGEIPLTFIAVAVIYLGGEIVNAFSKDDQVSQMAHLLGGATGAVFGFVSARRRPAGLRTKTGADVLAPKAAARKLL
ncbi:MAG TPA: rhomboid family intramembrane serine protease [Kofleriaceae bacterium]|nr:rhomboid family intramembrane serine protease [Kofleriaceae bacterium]